MGIDQLAYSEVLRADKAFQFDLFVRFIKENINLVHVIQALVKQHCLNLLLREELLQFNQPILF